MPSEFRFLVMCVSPDKDGRTVTLGDVVSDVMVPQSDFPFDLKLYAVVGAVLRRPMWGKRLDLIAWELDKTLKRQKLAGYAGTPLILPEETGPAVCPYPINVPLLNPGIYGFELFDPDGLFGPPSGLLATYMYGVHAVR